ncbi:methyl-accepting chemotaxis protein [Geomonas sp.]|uniref:methyl-accepting chemotaxis protein n=1 Tax=Geomonas sp. TaxID=2651584 RepID=UPI002B481D56|nr:methyl-accepting chemotaxis protein [Geomonas sp.]
MVGKISAGDDVVAAAALPDEVARLSAGWTSVLDGIAAELGEIARSTEDEFLAIGGRLQEFYQSGLGISALAGEMVGEVAGDRVIEAMTQLAGLLDEMERYVGRARSEIGASSDTLKETLSLLEQVSEPLSGFKKVNKVLRMLGISTKIESARLGQSAAGFDTLASDVGELSVQVNDKAAVIINRKEELTGAIAQTLRGVLESGAQQHQQVITILDKTRRCLETLTAINGRCSGSVTDVSAMSGEVTRSIGEVVISMQTHDIVRQQIEHVEQSLRELVGGISSGLAGADDAACICELQAAQLAFAGSELDSAVHTIIASLREIANKQSSLSRQTRGMAGLADQTGGSFFTEMERDVSVVGEALLKSSQVSGALGSAMHTVAETVEEIAIFVADIERIGEEIKLIALNAQIKSAYTGEEGAALGVLAEAIQRLSIDAIDHTGSVSAVLQSIIAVTERLRGIEEGCDQGEQVSTMVASLASLLEVLREVNLALRRSLLEMDETVSRLSAEIEQTTSGIAVHQQVSQVLERAIQGLSAIAAEARRLAPASSGKGQQFDTLASRYTMQSERNIHRSLLEQSSGELNAPPVSDQELGGNVELF